MTPPELLKERMGTALVELSWQHQTRSGTWNRILTKANQKLKAICSASDTRANRSQKCMVTWLVNMGTGIRTTMRYPRRDKPENAIADLNQQISTTVHRYPSGYCQNRLSGSHLPPRTPLEWETTANLVLTPPPDQEAHIKQDARVLAAGQGHPHRQLFTTTVLALSPPFIRRAFSTQTPRSRPAQLTPGITTESRARKPVGVIRVWLSKEASTSGSHEIIRIL